MTTYNDFPELVVSFLREKPNDEALFEFADKHGADRVLLAIQEKVNQVELQRQGRKLDLEKALASADEQEASSLKREHAEWDFQATVFYKAITLAKSKLKAEFVTADGPKHDKWDKQIRLLTRIAETLERIEAKTPDGRTAQQKETADREYFDRDTMN